MHQEYVLLEESRSIKKYKEIFRKLSKYIAIYHVISRLPLESIPIQISPYSERGHPLILFAFIISIVTVSILMRMYVCMFVRMCISFVGHTVYSGTDY